MTKQCLQCGGDFEAHRDWQNFCCIACRNKYHNTTRNELMKILKGLTREQLQQTKEYINGLANTGS